MSKVYKASGEGRVILCIGHNAWGSGLTSTEAIRNWRKAGPFKGTRDYITVPLFDIDERFEVDCVDGSVRHPESAKPIVFLGDQKVKVRR
jgi:hypothetical protein